MNRVVIALICLFLMASGAIADPFALSWTAPLENGIDMRIQGFFADPEAEANADVHLVVGNAAVWDSCGTRIDLGEIQRRGDDGWVVLDIGDLIHDLPCYAYFVRGDDHDVFPHHEITDSEQDLGPPGAAGQPIRQ